jgi:hypothetical protein
MVWRTLTKLDYTDAGVSLRWYWRKEHPAREESVQGFLLRSDCEADAVRHGCRPEDQAEERRLPLSGLFAPQRAAA